MAQVLNPWSGRQFLDANGDPYVGAQLFSYVSSATGTGGTTKQTLTKDAAGASNHANPIILNARGEPGDGAGASKAMWQPAGVYVKLVLAPAADSDPPTTPISTWDNLAGINDTVASASVQWLTGPTPTYVSAVSFTLVGDQTSDFHIGRRVKTTNTGGTIYSTIITSAYTTLTTITVVNDSSTLDSGLSAVEYGLLTATNPSLSTEGFIPILGPDVGSATALPYPSYGNYSDVTGTTTITSFDTSGEIGTVIKRHFDGALILTHHATDLVLPGGANITTAAGDEVEFVEYASGDWRCLNYQAAAALPLTAFEEGTWTPTIQDSSKSDAESQTYTVQDGHYTKIGNRVLISGVIAINSLGALTTSDPAFIAGLPFTSGATASQAGSISVGAGGSLNLTAGQVVTGAIDPSAVFIDLNLWDDIQGVTGLTIAELSTGGTLTFEGQYTV